MARKPLGVRGRPRSAGPPNTAAMRIAKNAVPSGGGRLNLNSNKTPALPACGPLGVPMATAQTSAPTREDCAALLHETYGPEEALEGSVVKGRVVAIEKDMAVIDVGLKTEGRVALKEFTNHGREA